MNTHFLTFKNYPLNTTLININGAKHDNIFMAHSFAPLAILLIYGRYIGIPYLQTPHCCSAVSKTAARERKMGCVWKSLPQLKAASNQGVS